MFGHQRNMLVSVILMDHYINSFSGPLSDIIFFFFLLPSTDLAVKIFVQINRLFLRMEIIVVDSIPLPPYTQHSLRADCLLVQLAMVHFV